MMLGSIMKARGFLVLVLAILAVTAHATSLREATTEALTATETEAVAVAEAETEALSAQEGEAASGSSCLGYKKLGDGYCREKYDHYGNPQGTGHFKLYRNIYTKNHCEHLCSQYSGCTGYEYDDRSHRYTCEVHTGHVGAYKYKHGVQCYQRYNKCTKPNYCKFELVGKGFCREGYDHWGQPYGKGNYKTHCNAKNPCTQDQCKEACAGYSWCLYYEFQDIDTHYADPYAGRCELYRDHIYAYERSNKAVCYKKKC